MKQKTSYTIFVVLLLFFSVVGLITSIYLADLHYQAKSSEAICDINSTVSCTNLAQSEYSKIGPIPIAVLGIMAYVVFTIISLLLLFPNKIGTFHPKITTKNLAKAILSLAAISLLFTIYLIIVELVVSIFCLGCLVSWIATAGLFITSYLLYQKV